MVGPLANPLPAAALAFRGFNQTNLGKTPDLLAVPAYRATVERRLAEASALCADAIGRPVDLVARVANRSEPGIDAYAEAIALVFAAELAQLDLLTEFHGIDPRRARAAFGYSLGELTAVAACGLYSLEAVMRPPLVLAEDCAALAAAVRMGVVFSRRAALDETLVHRTCEEITAEGDGAIAVSAVLSPNTMLLIGGAKTHRRFRDRYNESTTEPVTIRLNDGVWPPLHTPLVCAKHIPDRAALMIREARRLVETPRPPIWSMVTGEPEYATGSGRDVLRRWVDSPQRLWDIVERTLASDVRLLIHVGPEPNVIPATFRRLADNVLQQTLAWSLSGVGLRAVQRMAGSTWLAPLLPKSGCLLRAPRLEHVMLEDWLLENAPG